MAGYPAINRAPGQVSIKGMFTINGSSDPDGLTISGVTVTRTAAGQFKVAIDNNPEVFVQFDYLDAKYSVDVERAATDQAYVAYVTASAVPSGTTPGYFVIETYTIDGSGQLVASEVDNVKVSFEAVIRQFASPDS